MNRSLTALFAALEALLVVGIGIGIPLVPLTFMWAFQYGLQLDWTVFWRASVDTWLVGHGADVLLTLDPVTAIIVGFEGAGTPFLVSIAALGFALLTALLGVRAGRRITETPHRMLGLSVALLVFAALALGATLSAVHRFARPSIWQGVFWPTLVFAVGLLIGSVIAGRRLRRMPGFTPRTSRLLPSPLLPSALLRRARLWWSDQPAHLRAVLAQSLRGGTAVVAAVLACSGVLLAVLIVTGYGEVIALYEGIHAEILGGIALTLGQLAFLPNLVIWVGSWLIGPGFAIGTGSSVGPLGTSLGPLPAIPIFGVLPAGDLALGFLGLLVPVVAGFLVGVAIRPRLLAGIGERGALPWLVTTGVGIGVVGGLLFGLLAWVSGGAAGPGRLADVGPDAWLVGAFAALEFGIPAILGLLAGAQRGSR